jgi:hypothetical protein
LSLAFKTFSFFFFFSFCCNVHLALTIRWRNGMRATEKERKRWIDRDNSVHEWETKIIGKSNMLGEVLCVGCSMVDCIVKHGWLSFSCGHVFSSFVTIHAHVPANAKTKDKKKTFASVISPHHEFLSFLILTKHHHMHKRGGQISVDLFFNNLYIIYQDYGRVNIY